MAIAGIHDVCVLVSRVHSLSNFATNDGVLFCKQHFMEKFKKKGGCRPDKAKSDDCQTFSLRLRLCSDRRVLRREDKERDATRRIGLNCSVFRISYLV